MRENINILLFLFFFFFFPIKNKIKLNKTKIYDFFKSNIEKYNYLLKNFFKKNLKIKKKLFN